jgi:hypothetical protein
MEIPAGLFFEVNAEDIGVELSTCLTVGSDGAKTRDEQNPAVFH